MNKDNIILSPAQKALRINLDKDIYGSFVEIGAGQEVARQFFRVGSASTTIVWPNKDFPVPLRPKSACPPSKGG